MLSLLSPSAQIPVPKYTVTVESGSIIDQRINRPGLKSATYYCIIYEQLPHIQSDEAQLNKQCLSFLLTLAFYRFVSFETIKVWLLAYRNISRYGA